MPERAQNMGNCPKKVSVVLTTYKIDIKSVVFSVVVFTADHVFSPVPST